MDGQTVANSIAPLPHFVRRGTKKPRGNNAGGGAYVHAFSYFENKSEMNATLCVHSGK